MIKVLVITYYWPPSGGAGVQRWLKLTKYLAELGAEVHVLSVDPAKASYLHLDKSLEQDISPKVKVHQTNSFEPINYYAKIVGKKNVPTAGFSNVDNSSFKQKLVNSIRSHLFIPDPRKGWNSYALKEAKKIIREHGIDVVVTTSPPHSTQLIGLKLKRQLGIKWLADFRDPWTDIYYYDILGHSKISHAINKGKEHAVVTSADRMTATSPNLKRILASKDAGIKPDHISVIPNGYDEEDFEGLTKEKNEVFTISYTGTMSETYGMEPFLKMLQSLRAEKPEADFLLEFVGIISDSIIQQIKDFEIPYRLVPPVTHDEVVKYQKQADMLLLVIPETKIPKGIIPGKLFEYLASGNPVFCLGPADADAANIIRNCEAGDGFARSDAEGMKNFILKHYQAFKNDQPFKPDSTAIQQYSRKAQAGAFLQLLTSLNES